jgi:hypothetical protein
MKMENEITITVRIPNAMAFGSKVAGEWLPIDLSKLANSYLVELLRYGAQRKVNDNAKGETPQKRLDIARLAVNDMNEGKELPMKAVRASQVTPVRGKARKLAHVAIRDYFATNGGDYKAAYGGKKAAEQTAMRDEWITANPELLVTAGLLLEQEAKAKEAALVASKTKGAELARIFA